MLSRTATTLLVVMALAPAAASAQTPAVDSGFRPATDGFSFANYDKGEPDLTAAEMRRLFGDVVCGSEPGNDCALTPAAKEWMDRTNEAMAGGHCYGMSVTALQFFVGTGSPATFGAPATFGLAFGPPIRREIAYTWAYQTLESVNNAKIEGTPKQVLERLRALLATKAETYTIAIFKPGFKDGHAVTPYAIEDRGGGKSAIKVYDNNFPNQEREIIIDTVADTFEYNTATNPNEAVDLYTGGGDSKEITLYLMPTTPGQGVQGCPFCGGGGGDNVAEPDQGERAARRRSAAAAAVEVATTGALTRHASVTISSGRRMVGLRRGRLIDQFGGDSAIRLVEQRASVIRREPLYTVPARRAYEMTLTNKTKRSLRGEGLRITGPAFGATVRGLKLAKGQRVAARMNADGTRLSFRSNRSLDTSTISIGRTEPGVDHAFVLNRGSVLPRGERLVFAIDPDSDELKIEGDAGTYDLLARRVDKSGDMVFVRNNVRVMDTGGDEDELTLDYSKWDGTVGSVIVLEDGDGTEREIESQVPPGTNPDKAEEQVSGDAVPGTEEEEEEDDP